jgi:hypothetical protein
MCIYISVCFCMSIPLCLCIYILVCVFMFGTCGRPFVRRFFTCMFLICFCHLESQRLLVSAWTRLCSCLPGWFCSGAAGRKHQGLTWSLAILAMLATLVDVKQHQMTPRAWPVLRQCSCIEGYSAWGLATTCLSCCSLSAFNLFGFLHLRTGSSGCWAPRSKSPVKKHRQNIWEASGTQTLREFKSNQ